MERAWAEFCEQLGDAGRFVFDPAQPADDIDRAEGVRHVLRMLARAIGSEMENRDVGYPELGWVYPTKIGQDNPDGLYQVAPIDLRHGYRLSGNIGSVRYLGLTLMTFNFGDGPVDQLLTINGDALPADGQGDFDVVFSPSAAPEGTRPGARKVAAHESVRPYRSDDVPHHPGRGTPGGHSPSSHTSEATYAWRRQPVSVPTNFESENPPSVSKSIAKFVW